MAEHKGIYSGILVLPWWSQHYWGEPKWVPHDWYYDKTIYVCMWVWGWERYVVHVLSRKRIRCCNSTHINSKYCYWPRRSPRLSCRSAGTLEETKRGKTGSVRMQKVLGNKQNDVRYDVGKTRVVVETIVTSVPAKWVNKDLDYLCKLYQVKILWWFILKDQSHVAIVVGGCVAS